MTWQLEAKDKEDGLAESTYETMRTKGLNFTVPQDWPIKKHGGVVAPIPVEEYVVMRFGKIETELASMRQDLEKKLEDFFSETKLTNSYFLDKFSKMQLKIDDIQVELSNLVLSLELLESKMLDIVKNSNRNTKALDMQMSAVREGKMKAEALKRGVDSIKFSIDMLDERMDSLEQGSVPR